MAIRLNAAGINTITQLTQNSPNQIRQLVEEVSRLADRKMGGTGESIT